MTWRLMSGVNSTWTDGVWWGMSIIRKRLDTHSEARAEDLFDRLAELDQE